ncbi:hypothetical protein O181_039483 [Austropuccinia psidii MF-1]|uniref:Uncharacterized protein n=1 Tax=Austropuccinia psidii MF-1 TaxID=1389203 RepID=A0A9Q3DFE5_9BASI|nr:hypothetical protein [Austropuccinia psidii MF-1]
MRDVSSVEREIVSQSITIRLISHHLKAWRKVFWVISLFLISPSNVFLPTTKLLIHSVFEQVCDRLHQALSPCRLVIRDNCLSTISLSAASFLVVLQ